MIRLKLLIGVGAAAMISTAVHAADMAPPPPYQPPMTYQPAVVPAVTGGWYLRGDVGVGMQQFSTFDLEPASTLPSTWTIVQKDMQDTALADFGVGYEVNSWLRIDVTGEYRTKAAFKALGTYNQGTCTVLGVTGTCLDGYEGNFSAAVFMANAYVDLGTWWCLTPYIGAGVGTARDSVTGVSDTGYLPPGTVGFGYTYNDSANWNLAWNVQAGLTYSVSNALKIDFSWRYLSMGAPQSAEIYCQNTGATGGCNYFNLKDMSSNDFRIGLRWMLQPEVTPVMPQPALSTRG